MIGKLGVNEVAAVGASGKPFFIVLVLLMGISSGAGILVAQYWGNKDSRGVSKNIILSIVVSLLVATPLCAILHVFAEQIVGFASADGAVISLGSGYLKIISFNLLFQSLNITLYSGLRSTDQASKCTLITLAGVLSNIALNFILIFGLLGFPPLGLMGAAYATLISCFIEMILVLLVSLKFNSNFTLSIKIFLVSTTKEDIQKLMKVALPISINGIVWSAGIYIYFLIYGRLGSSALAVMTLLGPIDTFGVSFFMGVASGSSILLGHALGGKEYDRAWYESWLFLALGFFTGCFLALSLLLFDRGYLSLFSSIDAATLDTAEVVYRVFLLQLLCKSVNVTAILGILRSGGDTRFVLFLDMLTQWLVGIPLGLLGAFVWKLPLVWVFTLILGEEIVKMLFAVRRIGKKKWLNNLIEAA